jgi:hypothetical protein
VELHEALRIRVRRREEFFAYRDADIELFAKLAREARCVRFAPIAFAAGEFPIAFEVDAFLAPGDEKAIVALDHCGRHDDRRHLAAWRGAFVLRVSRLGLKGKARQLFTMGHTRHLGFRATHTMAPKSISAWLKSKA